MDGKSRVDAVDPAAAPRLDGAWLVSRREGCRHLASPQAGIAHPVGREMPEPVGPEVEALHEARSRSAAGRSDRGSRRPRGTRRSRPGTRRFTRLLAAVLAGLAWGSLPAGAAPAASSSCGGVRFEILTPPLASTPFLAFPAGGRTGPWLLDFGSTLTSLYAASWPGARPGEPVRLSGFGFPGAEPGPRSLPVVEGGQRRAGIGAPLGVVGTDILKGVTTVLHFENASDPHAVFLPPACGHDPAGRGGFLRFGQRDVFGSAPETHGSGLPNVPVVAIALEERSIDPQRPRLDAPRRTGTVRAQVDTGYADAYWPHAVDINEPFLAQLKETVPSLAIAGLVSVAGCGREDTLRPVYVAPGWRLQIVPDMPQRTIPFDSFYLVVKPTRTECGGIGAMRMPAAQLGASFLRAFGTTAFVPSRAEMWIRPPDR